MNASEELHAQDLARRLSEAEATIEALLSGQIDAVVDARSQTPVLLSRAQEALRESEARFRQLAESIREVFFLTDPAMAEMFYVSPAYEDIFGRSRESLYASPRSWGEAMHPDDRWRLPGEMMPQGILVPFDVEYRIVRPDGGERSVRSRAFPIRNAAGETFRFAGFTEDITGRKLLEAQFRQAQKMEGIGRLASGIAHDFNNLLTAILGFGEMTLAELPPDGQMREDVQEIVNAGRSAAMLTRQLLAFSRQQVLEPVVLDLNTLVGGMQTLLGRVIGEDVTLVTTLGGDARRIKADPGQMEQVIMNLAVNARDAMPSGGTLRIATEGVDLDNAFVAAHPGAAKGPYVRLTFADTGSGMGPDVLARLFEPFFTTKEHGKGTGLGLATVYGIVKQSDGHIWVQSAPGKGASFMIDLPSVSTATLPAVASTETGARILAGTETILLVEDQQELRDVVRLTLQRQGYDVLEAADGRAALELLKACDGPVHLLLTDVVMPHMNGRQLFDSVARHDGSVRVLYTSGYTDEAIVKHGVLNAGIDLIHKPFTPGQLLARVRDVLDRPDQRQAP